MLDILYGFYNDDNDHLVQKEKVIDEKSGQVSYIKQYDFNNIREMGLSPSDIIAPSSMNFQKSHMQFGNKFARALKVTQYPSRMSDEFLNKVTDLGFNCLTTINYKPIPAKEAEAIVGSAISAARAEKQDAMKAGQKHGIYDDSCVSTTIIEREAEALAMREALHEKDERLFEVSLSVVVFADSLDKLNENTDLIVTEYKKLSTILSPMKDLQEEGFNSTLPLCFNQIRNRRTLTGSTAAMFIPFSTLELTDEHGINYSCNLLSKNLIVYDRLKSNNFNGFILGTPGCVDSETEFFNGTEWKSIASYEKGEQVLQFNPETNEATLVVPEAYIKKPCEKMYHFKGANTDQMLSEEHRVLYYALKKRGLDFQPVLHEKLAKDVAVARHFKGKIKADFSFNGHGIALTNEQIALMIAIFLEGGTISDEICSVRIVQTKRKNNFFKILKSCNIDYNIIWDDKRGTTYKFVPPRMETEVTKEWYSCSSEQLKFICSLLGAFTWLFLPNCSNDFRLKSKANAEFIQFVFTACGCQASVKRSGESFYLKIRKNPFVCLGDVTEERTKDGFKYCFTVPTGALVLRRNGHIFITGNSGKSFTAKTEMLNVFLNSGSDIIVIDPEDEYGALAKLLGGEVIRITPGGHVHLNPLDISPDEGGENPLNAKADFVLKIVECILDNPYGMGSVQKTITDECVQELYAPYLVDGKLGYIPPEKMPTLTDLQRLLAKRVEPEARELAMALKRYSGTGSLNAFGFQTNVNPESRFVVYQIRDLGDGLKPLAMLSIMEIIWNKIVENRKIGRNTWFYVDEIYLLFQQEYSASFLNQLFRRARKYGGVPTGITQNVKPLLENATARDMLQNCCFIEILSQAGPDRQELQKLLNLSEQQLGYITNSPKGQGLLYTGKNVVPFFAQFPKNNNIYRALTSDLKEIKAYEENEKK